MHTTVSEVLAAREALARAAAEIEQRLVVEAPWLALRQLDERKGQGQRLSAIDESELRARLERRLDAGVPEWRMLGGIEAAVAALDGVRPNGSPTQVPSAAVLRSVADGLPPTPLTPARPRLSDRLQHTTGQGDDPQLVLRRIRSIDDRRIAEEASVRPSLTAPTSPLPGEVFFSGGPTASSGGAAATGSRISAATAFGSHAIAPSSADVRPSVPSSLVDADQARIDALELEVEQLMQSRAAAIGRSGEFAGGPRPSAVGIDLLEPIGGCLRIEEEAEVEIVTLAGDDAAGQIRPQRLTEALAAPIVSAALTADGDDPAFSLQAHLDEASVEIVILDRGTGGKAV